MSFGCLRLYFPNHNGELENIAWAEVAVCMQETVPQYCEWPILFPL